MSFKTATRRHSSALSDLDTGHACLETDPQTLRDGDSTESIEYPWETTEGVEIERQRGIENMANLRKVVERQDYISRAILAKINEGNEIQSPKKVGKQRPTMGLCLSGESESIRSHNADVIASTFKLRQDHKDHNQQCRSHVAAEEVKYHDSLRQKHDRIHQQVAQRQQELVEKQLERTLLVQQRRNEQQKMLKEIQRSQDHQFELMQLKHHPTAVSTHKPPSRAQTPSQPPKPPTGEPAKMSHSASEPVSGHRMQSHKLFGSTLDQWKVVEADNERRGDAYWRKITGDEVRRPKETKPDASSRSFSVLRQTASTITNRFPIRITGH